jgi:hypothetical protein
MSATPPEQQQPTSSYDRPAGGPNVNLNLSALMPTPGNAELVVYILATIILGIIALSADDFDANGFATIFGVITLGYLISRGIAKASRVLER